MKKEKWLLREIERWKSEEIVSVETADILKERYKTKKNVGLLIVLFSVIGTLFIGMGILLIGANNWWYDLPVEIRTIIAFFPLICSHIILFYVFKNKMSSIAFREGASILNMAGVFSSIAIVGQIFHLPGNFTSYIFVCGILSLPSMLAMNAIAPLVIYYWTILNGGAYLDAPWGMVLMLFLYGIGAAFAIYNFRAENCKSIYAAWITIISGFVAMVIFALNMDCPIFTVLIAYFTLILSVSALWKCVGMVFESIGMLGSLIMIAIFTYREIWRFSNSFIGISIVFPLFLVAVIIFFLIKNFINKQGTMLTMPVLFMLIIRIIGDYFGLDEEPFDLIFAIISNIILFIIGVGYIWSGAKNIDLMSINIGMVTVCTLIVMRFFDSEIPLFLKGIVFLCLGIGFLLVNIHLIRIKKRTKEESI